MSRWFRHYAGMMRDDKLVRVAIRSGQTIERVVWIWGAILESAAEIDEDGRYDLDAAEIAYFLRADEADVDAVLSALADAGRVADDRVVKWGNRQFQSDRSKDRVAAHRERKRQAESGSNRQSEACNGDVTLHGGRGNAPETETETKTDNGEANASPRGRAQGARLPDEWEPKTLTSDTVSGKIVAARGHDWAARALESFKNHWRSANGPNARKRDWQAAWANWIIEQDNRDGRREQRSHSLARHQPSDGLSSTARAAIHVFGQ